LPVLFLLPPFAAFLAVFPLFSANFAPGRVQLTPQTPQCVPKPLRFSLFLLNIDAGW
jgi:hypothetical protein